MIYLCNGGPGAFEAMKVWRKLRPRGYGCPDAMEAMRHLRQWRPRGLQVTVAYGSPLSIPISNGVLEAIDAWGNGGLMKWRPGEMEAQRQWRSGSI